MKIRPYKQKGKDIDKGKTCIFLFNSIHSIKFTKNKLLMPDVQNIHVFQNYKTVRINQKPDFIGGRR
jgi:hypothetical protein